MSSPNTLLYLTNIAYLPEKQQIAVEFSNPKEKTTLREKFFPKIHVSYEEQGRELIKEVLSVYDKHNYELNFLNETLEIKASTFSDLRNITLLLQSSLRITALIIEPERQFLIEKNWSYFDSFKFKNKKLLHKEELFIAPKTQLPFLPNPLAKTLRTLIPSNTKSAEELVERLLLSNTLRVPLQRCPKTAALKAELFLENIFFKHRFPMPKDSFAHKKPEQRGKPKGIFTDLIEFDFSPLWSTLCTFPFFNLGPDTINCKCCKPKNLNAENISPASLVRVKFLQDGIYFQSKNQRWLQEFHLSNENKEARLRRMREFGLQATPAGPFFRNQTESVPLVDAQKLLIEGKIETLTAGHSITWFCRSKESFLSKEINNLNKKISAIEKLISKQERKSLYKYGLVSSNYLSNNENYFYRINHLTQTMDLLNYLTIHLTSANTKFHSSKFTEIIETIQASVVESFSDFSSENGAKTVAASPRRAFLESSNALAIAKGFSSKYRIPEPQILKKWHSLRFS